MVLDVRCDPDVPPIPPHATLDEAMALASAMIHGDEDRWGVIAQSVKQKIQQVLPGAR